jgi:cell division septation protein DedD
VDTPTRKPTAAQPTRTAAAAPRAAASSSSSQYVVQVAARKSQTDALAAFADLQQKYPSLLNNYRPIIERADLGSKGVWYRLRVGPLKQKTSAANLCQKLKSAGMSSCLVRSYSGS